MGEKKLSMDQAVDRIGRKIIATAPDGCDVILIFAGDDEEVAMASNVAPLQIAKRLRELIAHLEGD